MHKLCQTRPDYRSLWDNQKMVGTRLAQLLAFFGITKQRVQYVFRKPCKCKKRQAAMDAAKGESVSVLDRVLALIGF